MTRTAEAAQGTDARGRVARSLLRTYFRVDAVARAVERAVRGPRVVRRRGGWVLWIPADPAGEHPYDVWRRRGASASGEAPAEALAWDAPRYTVSAVAPTHGAPHTAGTSGAGGWLRVQDDRAGTGASAARRAPGVPLAESADPRVSYLAFGRGCYRVFDGPGAAPGRVAGWRTLEAAAYYDATWPSPDAVPLYRAPDRPGALAARGGTWVVAGWLLHEAARGGVPGREAAWVLDQVRAIPGEYEPLWALREPAPRGWRRAAARLASPLTSLWFNVRRRHAGTWAW